MKLTLTDFMPVNFHELIAPFIKNEISDIVMTGGRGSCKSSVASLLLVSGMTWDYYVRGEITHSVVLRKIGNSIDQSVYSQIKWAINILGQEKDWHCTKNPFMCVNKNTGQSIRFFGCDDPIKIKSIKTEKGYIKYRWYEEYNQFDGEYEIRSLNFSLARGGKCIGLYTYNPDPQKDDWANLEALREETNPRSGRIRHHSTFETVNPDWLGPDFYKEAEYLKTHDLKGYENELLGIVTGVGGNVFKNIRYVSYSDDEILTFDKIRQGLDFGFTIDPSAFIKNCYIRNKKEINLFDEIFEYEVGTRQLSELIKRKYNKYEVIKADSQEQRTINTMITEYNVNVIGCEKGPDSVRHGIEYLADLRSINIDKKRCPNIWREFKLYQFEKNKKTGEFIKKYPDENNHTIDAVRYSMDDIILASGWRVNN